jgi:hypothetical protein
VGLVVLLGQDVRQVAYLIETEEALQRTADHQ